MKRFFSKIKTQKNFQKVKESWSTAHLFNSNYHAFLKRKVKKTFREIEIMLKDKPKEEKKKVKKIILWEVNSFPAFDYWHIIQKKGLLEG